MTKPNTKATDGHADGDGDIQPHCSDGTTITVSGVTFGACQVKSAVVTICGRDIHIAEKSDDENRIGFQ